MFKNLNWKLMAATAGRDFFLGLGVLAGAASDPNIMAIVPPQYAHLVLGISAVSALVLNGMKAQMTLPK